MLFRSDSLASVFPFAITSAYYDPGPAMFVPRVDSPKTHKTFQGANLGSQAPCEIQDPELLTPVCLPFTTGVTNSH